MISSPLTCIQCKKPIETLYEDDEEDSNDKRNTPKDYCAKCSRDLERFVSAPDYTGFNGDSTFSSSLLARRPSSFRPSYFGQMAPMEKRVQKAETELGLFAQRWLRKHGRQIPQQLLTQISHLASRFSKEYESQNEKENQKHFSQKQALSGLIYLVLLNSPEFSSVPSLSRSIMECFSPIFPISSSFFIKGLSLLRTVPFLNEFYLSGVAMRHSMKRENAKKTLFSVFERELAPKEPAKKKLEALDDLLKEEKIHLEEWLCLFGLVLGLGDLELRRRMAQNQVQISNEKLKKTERRLFLIFHEKVKGEIKDEVVKRLVHSPNWTKSISNKKMRLLFECADLYLLENKDGL